MNIFLWILQAVLGVTFLSVGFMKAFQPSKIQASMSWAKDRKPNLVKFVGFAELVGGIGLILPWAINIAPILTPISAIGLGIIMILAAILHAKRKENSSIGLNIVLLILLVLIVIGRF